MNTHFSLKLISLCLQILKICKTTLKKSKIIVSAQSHVYQRFNGSWQPPPANQHPAYPGWNYSTYYNQQTYHQHNPYVQPCTNVMNPYTNYNSNTQQQQLNTATSSSVQNDHNGSVHNFEGTSNVQSKNIIDIPLDDKMHQLSNPSLPLKQTKRNSLETPSPYSELVLNYIIVFLNTTELSLIYYNSTLDSSF